MLTLRGKPRDLGDGFRVARVLPQIEQRAVGPFVFFDYFGPVEFAPGKGIDVRPHPHIGLATVTYLFEGAQVHRDSLGSVQAIEPGDVNWMTAGRGIVHSERTGPEMRAAGHRMHGIQSWVGLPTKDQEVEPSFQHVGKADLPVKREGGVTLGMVTGEAFGLISPVKVFSPIFYADAQFEPGASLKMCDKHEERAVFMVAGTIEIDGEDYAPGDMAVLGPGEDITIISKDGGRAMLLGGAPLDGERHLYWNFVSSSKERIEQAKADWKAMRFNLIPDDHDEFIPLPDAK